MSIEVRVPEEIKDYKENIIAGLSVRQLICGGIALLCGIPTFLLLKNINMDIATYATMLVVVPAFCVGFIKKDGYTFENYIKIRMRSYFVKTAEYMKQSPIKILFPQNRDIIQKIMSTEVKKLLPKNTKAIKKLKNQENMTLLKSQKKLLKEKERQRLKALKQRQENIERKNRKKKKKLKNQAAPKSCQDTLKYKYMYPNGICQTGENFFSKMLKFSDINYQVAQRDEQIDIFSRYCEILNYFDPNVNVQITVHNRRIDKDEFKSRMLLEMLGDDKDELRQEYNSILLNKAFGKSCTARKLRRKIQQMGDAAYNPSKMGI